MTYYREALSFSQRVDQFGQVLAMKAEGKSTKEIAQELGVSVPTVHTRIKRGVSLLALCNGERPPENYYEDSLISGEESNIEWLKCGKNEKPERIDELVALVWEAQKNGKLPTWEEQEAKMAEARKVDIARKAAEFSQNLWAYFDSLPADV